MGQEHEEHNVHQVIEGQSCGRGIRLFSLALEDRNRSSGWKFEKQISDWMEGKTALTIIPISKWKEMPGEVVSSPSLEMFQQKLDGHFLEMS